MYLANLVWSAKKLAGHPVVGGALCCGRACIVLTTMQDGVKVEIHAIHEVTIDDVVHVTIQVFCEHIDVQVRRQSVLTRLEAGRRSKLCHPLQSSGGIG